MSLTTQFGSLDYGNEQALEQWVAAHDIWHGTERKELSRRGYSLAPQMLTGEVGPEWLGRHLINHMSINRALAALNFMPAPLPALDMPWSNEAIFYAWHRAHNVVHAQTGSQLKINVGK